MEEKSIFETLNCINVNGHTEKKNGLTYLSWAWAWAEVKKLYPLATYKVYEREDGNIYWTDGKTAWVKTGVTINGLEHIEYLPIMDYNNRSITLDKITSFDVNKAIQRSLTKACARHGLGLYVYAGEDLPEEEPNDNKGNKNDKKEEVVFPYGKEEKVAESGEKPQKNTTQDVQQTAGTIDKQDLDVINEYLTLLKNEDRRKSFFAWLEKNYGATQPEMLTKTNGQKVAWILAGRKQ